MFEDLTYYVWYYVKPLRHNTGAWRMGRWINVSISRVGITVLKSWETRNPAVAERPRDASSHQADIHLAAISFLSM